jgi:site-specific DNA-cytosine methylase
LWLPLTYREVAAFFSGIAGFDMGLKNAQDLYGVAFRVVLAIDNSEEANFE